MTDKTPMDALNKLIAMQTADIRKERDRYKAENARLREALEALWDREFQDTGDKETKIGRILTSIENWKAKAALKNGG